MIAPHIWHGTPQEAAALAVVVARNCMCAIAEDGSPSLQCPVHQMILSQRVLDGLLYYRHLEARLMVEEFVD